jgi:hypothetical protein
MTSTNLSRAKWRKSSYSSQNGLRGSGHQPARRGRCTKFQGPRRPGPCSSQPPSGAPSCAVSKLTDTLAACRSRCRLAGGGQKRDGTVGA